MPVATAVRTAREMCPECRGELRRCGFCGGRGEVNVTAISHVACPTCDGRNSRYCPTCDGIGEVTQEQAARALANRLGTPSAKAAKRDVCQWITRPKKSSDQPGHWTARVAICGDVYDLTHSFAESEGFYWDVYDLHKQCVGGPKHHRLTVGPDGERCDCEHATYRPREDGHKACRHVRAVRALMAWLEQRELAEYAAECANRQIAEMPDECPMAAA